MSTEKTNKEFEELFRPLSFEDIPATFYGRVSRYRATIDRATDDIETIADALPSELWNARSKLYGCLVQIWETWADVERGVKHGLSCDCEEDDVEHYTVTADIIRDFCEDAMRSGRVPTDDEIDYLVG